MTHSHPIPAQPCDTTDRRVLVVGDSHGNTRWLAHAADVAAERGAGRILQLGDFGIWPGREGRRFLGALAGITDTTGIRVDFVDGNHDNHDLLHDLLVDTDRQAPDGSIVVTTGVHWWPRGRVSVIGGQRIGFLGGAVSVDRRRRTPGISWWEREVPLPSDLDALVDAADGQPLDLLVLHDAPHGVHLPSSGNWPADALADADDVRRLLLDAATATAPRRIVHGHWHLRHRTHIDLAGATVDVIGLGSEDDDGLALIDLTDDTIDDLGVAFPTLEALHEAVRHDRHHTRYQERRRYLPG
jgi:Icc-related predicted phosphoesterase